LALTQHSCNQGQSPKQTRLYYKPDIERVLAVRPPAVRQKNEGQDALAVLFEILTQMRPVNSPRPALHLALQEAAAYAGQRRLRLAPAELARGDRAPGAR
jgi:hypothetical protein